MEGYSKVAHFMASQEDFAILRRFRVLNIQRLLYLQAEIIHLESEVKQLAKRDTTHEDRIFHTKDWWSLSQAGSGEDLEQWQKFSELSEKLDLYSNFSSETAFPSTYLIKYIDR
jgi:nicotinamidase-related amidase